MSILSKGKPKSIKNKFNKFNFTEKEMIIIQHICKGLKSKEIAPLLNISKRTIENYRRKIKVKTNANKKSELIRFAIKHKII